MSAVKQDTKRLFRKKGTCSQTFFYIINREFGNNNELQERASDPLAGGIMQLGYQCGLLFGSALAVGKESYRRFKDRDQALAMAILTSKNVSDAFGKSAGSVNCKEITDTDFSKKIQFARFMIFKARACFNLADLWTQDAIRSAKEGLDIPPPDLKERPISCASEVAKKMGANEEEMIIVSGLAGGIGLTGETCGALSAAIWLRSIQWCRENPSKSSYNNPYASNLVFTFDNATGSKYLCREICGCTFKTIEEHSEYVKNGGCRHIIETLPGSV